MLRALHCPHSPAALAGLWWTEEDIIETTIGLVTGRRALIASPNGRGTRGAFRRGHRRRLQRRNRDVLEPHGGKQGKAREST